MIAAEFAHLSELVDDIKATGDATIAAIACRALGELLHDDFATDREKIDDVPSVNSRAPVTINGPLSTAIRWLEPPYSATLNC